MWPRSQSGNELRRTGQEALACTVGEKDKLTQNQDDQSSTTDSKLAKMLSLPGNIYTHY